MGNLHEWNAGGTAELLRFIQERSDDITKVVIPQHPYIIVDGVQIEAGLLVYFLDGDWKIVPNKQDAEAVLNDGILIRMKIAIELGR